MSNFTLLRQLASTVMADESHNVQELVHAVGGLALALTLMGKYLQMQAHEPPAATTSQNLGATLFYRYRAPLVFFSGRKQRIMTQWSTCT